MGRRAPSCLRSVSPPPRPQREHLPCVHARAQPHRRAGAQPDAMADSRRASGGRISGGPDTAASRREPAVDSASQLLILVEQLRQRIPLRHASLTRGHGRVSRGAGQLVEVAAGQGGRWSRGPSSRCLPPDSDRERASLQEGSACHTSRVVESSVGLVPWVVRWPARRLGRPRGRRRRAPPSRLGPLSRVAAASVPRRSRPGTAHGSGAPAGRLQEVSKSCLGGVEVPHTEAGRLCRTSGDAATLAADTQPAAAEPAAALASAAAAAASKRQRQRHPVHDPPSRRACTLSLSPVRRAGTERPAARSRAARIAAAAAAHLCGVGRAGGFRRAGRPTARYGRPLF